MDRYEVDQQVSSERVTVGLIPKTVEELERLRTKTGTSKTDVVNRSISLYAFITEQIQAGRQIVLRDPQTGELELVHLI